MAQEFLNQLLQAENVVQVNDDEAPTCIICLQRYGTFTDAGAVELEMRLPCAHKVGSACITKWLQENNSCPSCRQEFFPRQPRPYLEHGIMNEHPPIPTRRMVSHDETDPIEICNWLCEELILGDDVREVVQAIGGPMSTGLRVYEHRPACIAAMSVYIAWYLLNRAADDSTEILADLAHTSRVSQDHIRSTFRHIYPYRMRLVVPGILPGLARSHMDGILAFLPAPEGEIDTTNGEEENGRERGTSNEAHRNTVTSLWFHNLGPHNSDAEIRERLCETVGCADLLALVEDLSDHILDEINSTGGLLGGSDHLQRAVCAFMACHLLGKEISYSDTARVYGVSERSLRDAYGYVFPRRKELIQPETAETMGNGNIERILCTLPALNWPPVSE